MTGRGWLAGTPLLVGAAAALAVEFVAPRRLLYLTAAPALVLVVAGGLATGALLAARRVRGGARLRTERVVAGVRADADEARRRFVRRLDHELKNPLTALATALSGPGPGLDERSRAVARAQADRLRRLLADLRRVAEVETVALDRTGVAVADLLREAVDLAVADVDPARSVRIDVPSAPWPVPDVDGDPDLLLVAVYNVVANALKFTAPGATVEVRAREVPGPPPQVEIEVADTGPGIAPDEQEHVWEELARARTASGVPGSGIGLALVRTIVARHGGTVALHSRPGVGTSVQLVVPTGRTDEFRRPRSSP